MKTNLVLTSGNGTRFSNSGYNLPKALIPVDGVPMFIAATSYLPSSDEIIFVTSRKLLTEYSIDKVIRKFYPASRIIIEDSELMGQANSALQAKHAIDPETTLTIASCDCGVIFDQNKFNTMIEDSETHAIVWSARHYPPTFIQPNAYGWISLKDNSRVSHISYKIPISDTPYNDPIVIGHFTYKKASYCFENVEKMIRRAYKTSTEYSLDECTNLLIEEKLNVKILETDSFLCWGTPTELRTYEYWKSYFKIHHRRQ